MIDHLEMYPCSHFCGIHRFRLEIVNLFSGPLSSPYKWNQLGSRPTCVAAHLIATRFIEESRRGTAERNLYLYNQLGTGFHLALSQTEYYNLCTNLQSKLMYSH
jgi:hypothetical protein